MGWRIFFSSCAVVSVFGSGGKKVLIYIHMYYLEYNIDRNCDVLPLLKFCTNKPILALLLRHFFGGGGKEAFRPKKGCPRAITDF